MALGAEDPILAELGDLRVQLEDQLGTRIDTMSMPIDVFILNQRDTFEHFLRFYYPELPPRRAFFLAQGERRTVFTYRGPHLVEDLRHEATHALLHATVSDLPLWLDEGLAEYFESPASRGGAHAEHLARLERDIAEGWSPDLERLESLRDVRDMTARDYREAWAWTHYLLTGPRAGRAILMRYLAEVRSGEAVLPLSRSLTEPEGQVARQMIAHLERARLQPPQPNIAVNPTAVVVRGQDPSFEPVDRTTARRRGLLGRIAGFFGF